MVRGGTPLTHKAADIGVTLIVVAIAAVVLLPILWIVGTAFKPDEQFFTNPPTWIPHPFTLEHFKNVRGFNAGYRALLNSFVVSTTATIISMVIGTAAGYALARLRQRGNAWAVWFLSQRILPPIALVVPIFLLIRELGWINTWQGLIVPYIAINTPFVVWMMRGYFLDIPVTIEESALTEGCGRWSAFARVTLPLAIPGLLSTAIFVYLYCWGEFLIAVFITQTRASVTATVELPSFTIANDVLYGEVSALSLVSALPVLIMAIFAQRYFVRGLTLGALKR
jgi:multiple sugar transport system permease protein